MLGPIASFLVTFSGLIVFAGAYYIHQRVRQTRFACIVAMLGGLMTLASAIGPWVNQYARAVAILAAVGELVGIAVIVADVKGKKKGADRPALFAFFLVPIFFGTFLATMPTLLTQAGNGLKQVSSSVQTHTGR